jgi:hypothetical protein
VSFNINYFRPSIFGLEAAPELAAFVEAFAWDIEDPQSEGMGDGPFSVEGFLRGWNAGNRFGYRAFLGHAETEESLPRLSLPAELHRNIWRWNRAREAYMDFTGTIEMSAGFAPTVFLLQPEGEQRVVSAAIWAEAMSCAMPEVDVVLAMNEPGTPPRAIPQTELRALLDVFPTRPARHEFSLDGLSHDCGLPHWLVGPEDAPPALAEALRTLGEVRQFQRVAPDSVLDRELLAELG